MSFNQCTFMGNLTRDPESRQAGESTVTAFGIAVNEKYGDKESVMFLDCEAWGKQGDVITQHFGKGKQILVTGSLRLDTWQDKDGGNRSKHKLSVRQFSFVGPKQDGDAGGGQLRKPSRGNVYKDLPEDDIPF